LACVSAASGDIPPLMIFNRLRLECKLSADENTMFAQQKSGWMDGDIY